MTTPSRRRGWLLAMLFLVCVSLNALPAPAAQARLAAPKPKWAAWGLSVEFSGGAMRVLYKAYVATYDAPPVIVGSYDEDITASCTTNTGASIKYTGDYAVFDGTYYISCVVPSWRDKIRTIDPRLWPTNTSAIVATVGDGPLWAAADVVLDPMTASNPLLDARNLGVAFGVPRAGNTAQSVITLSSGTLASPSWNADDVAGNRLLLGTYGAAIVSFHNTFGWLSFLRDPAWQPYFSTNASGLLVGHWAEAPTRKSIRVAPVSSYTLATGSGSVAIGYDTATGSYFHGKIRSIRFDPGSKGL